MSMLFLIASCLQSPPVAPPAQSAPPIEAGEVIRRAVGPHFEVEVHFDSQLAADQALAAAESTVAPTESIYGKLGPTADPKQHPPRIVIYSELVDYIGALIESDELERKAHPDDAVLESFDPDPSVARPAVYSRIERASLVLVEPELTPDRLAALGLSMQTRLVVATQAVHLTGEELRPGSTDDASWFSEGAAEWAAEQGLAAAGWAPDRMEEPVFCGQARIVRAAILDQPGSWLAGIVSGLPDALTPVERVALEGAVFRFLKDPSRADVFARLSAAFRNYPCDDPVACLRIAVGGEDARQALEDAFVAYGKSLEPQWIETTPALTTGGTSWLQVATSDQAAIAWRTELAGSAHYAIEGELEMLPGPKQQMNVLLAGNEDDFVQVAIVAGVGVEVSRFEKKVDVVDHQITSAENWTKLGGAALGNIETAHSIPFRLVVDGTSLSVSMNGQPVCSAQLGEAAVKGTWGVGVGAGSAGRWRKIALTRL